MVKPFWVIQEIRIWDCFINESPISKNLSQLENWETEHIT